MISGLDHWNPLPGEDAAFLTFYRHQRPRLRRTLTAIASDSRFVDDVVQDALLIARYKWPEICQYDKPGAWVTKVALRLLRRHLKTDSKHYTPLVVDDDHRRPTGEANLGEVVAEHHDLYAAIRKLPRCQREAVAMHYLLDYAIADVAVILGASEGSIKKNLHMARRRLEQELGNHTAEGGGR
jgi:RNA polymerase sigma-70 factor (ECF subfamily)